MADPEGSAEVRAVVATARAVAHAPTVSIRNYLAVQHLWSAQHSARLCDERESELVAAGEINIDIEHRMLAIGAVMSAVAFLEAFVNELFQDAVESAPGAVTYRTEGLTDDAAALMRQLWKGGTVAVERSLSVLDRYQLGLVCARKPTLATDAEPYQAVDDLVKLRNALVHFVPETQEQDTEHKLQKRLRGRFAPNRQSIGQPVYPNSVLAAGCAAWACEASMKLVDEWQQRMGLVRDYRPFLTGFPKP
jgi:hypothetical protein